MRFIVDNALSPMVAAALRSYGFDALHVRDVGLQDASDTVIFRHAEEENRIIVSADTDFALILAIRNSAKPSVILFRGEASRLPSRQADLLRDNLAAVSEDLEKGTVVIFDGQRIRIRALPLHNE